MGRPKVLAAAVGTGRIGYVFLVDGQLVYWKMSRKANRSPEAARSHTDRLIASFEPDIVVTEELDNRSRKGEHARSIIAAIAATAEGAELLDVSVPRIQNYANKYVEAQALSERFPELAAQVPRKRHLWQSEPFSTIYFEALSLALAVIDKPEKG